jgi:hypothetical protein
VKLLVALLIILLISIVALTPAIARGALAAFILINAMASAVTVAAVNAWVLLVEVLR